MENLAELSRWFPSGTAEGERGILDKVFVHVAEFNKIMDPPHGSPYLLIGKKGSGKSAILDFATRVLSYQNVPCITIHPIDLETSDITDEDSIGDIQRRFLSTVLSAVCSKLAAEMSGFVSGPSATLYEAAIASDQMKPDFLGKMSRLLAGIAKPLTDLDFKSVFPDLESHTRDELEKAVSAVLKQQSFFIFVDDTDQVASPGKPGHLNRIWGLILALRALAARITELRVIITLRTEVWERLRSEAASQRDQTDHFESLRVVLSTDTDHIRKILRRRLSFATAARHSSGDPYRAFFEGSVARAPFSEDYRSWEDLILVRSRDRPRDAIQLVHALANHAAAKSADIIKEDDFRAVMPVFSEGRALLFKQEVEQECPQALEVLRTFARVESLDGGFRLTAEAALQHLRSVPSQFAVQLYGAVLRRESDDDMLALWRFLYVNNVLNARISDISQRESFRHLRPEEDLTLVSKSRWNDMQKMLWEVNPAFRDFLLAQQAMDTARIGLPIRKPRSRKRGK